MSVGVFSPDDPLEWRSIPFTIESARLPCSFIFSRLSFRSSMMASISGARCAARIAKAVLPIPPGPSALSK